MHSWESLTPLPFEVKLRSEKRSMGTSNHCQGVPIQKPFILRNIVV